MTTYLCGGPLHKLLKTWQLLASCEGGPSSSRRWHLNCPSPARWGRPPATTHTHTHTEPHALCLAAVKGQAQWCKVIPVAFFCPDTGADVKKKGARMHPNAHFLLLKNKLLLNWIFSHTTNARLKRHNSPSFFFWLLLSLTHTWIHVHTGIGMPWCTPARPCRWPDPYCPTCRPDGSRAEWLRTTGWVNMLL